MLSYPEVVTSIGEHLTAIAKHVRHEPRSEVTSEINSIASLPTEASTNAKDEEHEAQRQQRSGANVVAIDEGEDGELENGAGNDLGEEHAGSRHELGRIGAEDTGGGIGSGDSAETGAALIHVNGRLVVAINNGSSGHGAEDLSNGVDGELAPRVAAIDAVCKRHCGVDVAARFTTNIDSKHDADARIHVSELKIEMFFFILKLTPSPKKYSGSHPLCPC